MLKAEVEGLRHSNRLLTQRMMEGQGHTGKACPCRLGVPEKGKEGWSLG